MSTVTVKSELDSSTELESRTESVFSKSIFVSAVRCMFSYILLPLATPFVGLASWVGPGLGIVIGLIALGANIYSIRRFWVASHKWRKPITALHLSVIVLLLVLLYRDLAAL